MYVIVAYEYMKPEAKHDGLSVSHDDNLISPSDEEQR